MKDRNTDTEQDGYISLPVIATRNRRLFTFATPLRLQTLVYDDDNQVCPRLVTVVAGDGIEDGSVGGGEDGQAFLVLEHLFVSDGRRLDRIDLSGPDSCVIGVWVHRNQLASAQVRTIPWTRRSIRDLAPTKEE